jgi:hypothetical protein
MVGDVDESYFMACFSKLLGSFESGIRGEVLCEGAKAYDQEMRGGIFFRLRKRDPMIRRCFACALK